MFKCTMNLDMLSDRIKQDTIEDRRITPEQILHLCRILTERTANAHLELEYCTEQKNSKNGQDDKATDNHVSSEDFYERLSADVDDNREDRFASITCASKPKQAKKDILNKIRNQIFERKRQKLNNIHRSIGGVWRPW